MSSHIYDWWSAHQPAVQSSNAEGNRSWFVSKLVKILEGLQLMYTVDRTQLRIQKSIGDASPILHGVIICVTLEWHPGFMTTVKALNSASRLHLNLNLKFSDIQIFIYLYRTLITSLLSCVVMQLASQAPPHLFLQGFVQFTRVGTDLGHQKSAYSICWKCWH